MNNENVTSDKDKVIVLYRETLEEQKAIEKRVIDAYGAFLEHRKMGEEVIAAIERRHANIQMILIFVASIPVLIVIIALLVKILTS